MSEYELAERLDAIDLRLNKLIDVTIELATSVGNFSRQAMQQVRELDEANEARHLAELRAARPSAN